MVKQRKKAKKTVRTRKVWWWVILVLVGLVLVGVIVGAVIWWNVEGSKTALEKRGLPDRGVPVMDIMLADGLELSEIDGGAKEIKYRGNEVDLYDRGMVYKYGDVEVKGRGNLSWVQPKKSYQIKFAENVDLLGLGKAKKWVLLANYLDVSYLRNDIALNLAEMLEMPYNYRGDYVELYVDGNYRGLYYLVQRIEIAKGSVDLRKENGLLFEIDNLHNKGDEECYYTYLNECLVLKDAVLGNLGVIEMFLRDLNEAEEGAERGDYEKVMKFLDIDSFAKYYLVNEFVVNPDAYSTSFYLYRGDDGRIVAGPVWDFDLTLANKVWSWWTDENSFSPRETMIRRKDAFGLEGFKEDEAVSKLIYYLMEIPEFREEVLRIFQEKMSGRKNEFIQMINEKIKEIYMAAQVDNENWKKDSFEIEITAMLEWIKERYNYFEEVYGGDDRKPEAI